MQDLFYTAPLSPADTRLAFPLVQMSDPAVMLSGWLAYARRWARQKPDLGGLMAVRDRRGIMYALFSYVVERDFRLESCLHVGDIIAGRLPGADLDAAILFGIQELAERLGCRTLLIDVPVPPGKAPVIAERNGFVDPSFSPLSITFLRRSPGKDEPLRTG